MNLFPLAFMIWSTRLLFIEASTSPNPVRVSYTNENRHEHCSVYCPSLDVLLVIGGLGVSHPDFYSFKAETWSEPQKVSGSPPQVGRGCHLSLLESSAVDCKVVLVEGQADEPFEARVAKLSEMEDSGYQLEWFDNENPERSGPPGGHLYCATSLNRITYILGGFVDQKPTSQFWQVEVSFSPLSENVVTNWTNLNTTTGNTLSPITDCGLTSTNTEKLVLYGGSEEGERSNKLRYYDISTNLWLEPFEPSKTGKFKRSGPSLTFYDGNVYMYGGGFVRKHKWFYPRQVYSMTPNDTPRSNCVEADSTSTDVPLWCMYDESLGRLPINGVSRHSCVMRKSEMVCTFGSSLLYGNAQRRMISFDLNIMKNHLTVPDESVWIPSYTPLVSWVPIATYVAVGFTIAFYLHTQIKSTDTKTEGALFAGNTQDDASRNEAAFGVEGDTEAAPDYLIQREYAVQEITKIAEADNVTDANYYNGDGHYTNVNKRKGVSVDNIVTSSSKNARDEEFSNYVFATWSLVILGAIVIPSTSIMSPIPHFIFNIMMNLRTTYTVIHWLYWYAVVKKQQTLNFEDPECVEFEYAHETVSTCTVSCWFFAEFCGIVGMIVALVLSWFEVEEYHALNKDKPGYMPINFHENTLFSTLSLPLCVAAAGFGVLVVVSILYGIVETVYREYKRGLAKLADQNELPIANRAEEENHNTPLARKVSNEFVQGEVVGPSDTYTATVEHDVNLVSTQQIPSDTGESSDVNTSDINFNIQVGATGSNDSGSDTGDTNPNVGESTLLSQARKHFSTKLISLSLTISFFSIIFALICFLGTPVGTDLLPYIAIPGNIWFWVYIPCKLVFNLFQEVVVGKEVLQNRDGGISFSAKFKFFAIMLPLVVVSVTLLTFAQLVGQQLSLVVDDGQSIQVVLSELWLFWVVCAPTFLVGLLHIWSIVSSILCVPFRQARSHFDE